MATSKTPEYGPPLGSETKRPLSPDLLEITTLGAVALFAASGKPMMKKDLALISMTYGNIYVATVALGANPNQTVRAFAEADAGPCRIGR